VVFDVEQYMCRILWVCMCCNLQRVATTGGHCAHQIPMGDLPSSKLTQQFHSRSMCTSTFTPLPHVAMLPSTS